MVRSRSGGSKIIVSAAILAAVVASLLAILALARPASAGAAPPFEAETMIWSSGFGKVFSDSRASAGKALNFYENGTATEEITGTTGRLAVRARGDACREAPRMVVEVDGRQVISEQVTTGKWSSYGADVQSAEGAHQVTVEFTNDYRESKRCDRNLRVDKVSFTPGSGSTPPPPPPPPTGSPRPVFAHFQLAQARGNTVEVYKDEIRTAQEAGIDGFAVHTGSWINDSRYKPRTEMMYEAAKQLGTGFKLYISLELCCHTMPADHIKDVVRATYNHPNQYKVDGKAYLSTFEGQDDAFGYPTPTEGWQKAILRPLAAEGKPVYFVPNFYNRVYAFPPRDCIYLPKGCVAYQYDEFPFVDGLFFFNAFAQGSTGVTKAAQTNQNYWLESKEQGKSFTASVSPLYSVHVTRPDTGKTVNKVLGDVDGGEGMQQLWRGVIQDNPSRVELITWNDFGESTYFGPSHGGFPHDAYRELSKHYIQWYKAGKEPAITKDKLFYFYRPHSKNATASGDRLPKPESWDTTEDKIYTTAMLTRPATVKLTSGGTTKSFDLQAGIHNVSMPFQQGTQKVELLRGGAKVAESTGAVPISNTISTYNFNYYSNFVTAP